MEDWSFICVACALTASTREQLLLTSIIRSESRLVQALSDDAEGDFNKIIEINDGCLRVNIILNLGWP